MDARSIWGFLLIGSEAIRRHKISPYLVIREQPTIPTWTVPIALLLVAAVLMPSSSVLGHVCGLGVGYICMPPTPPFPSPEKTTTDSRCVIVGLGYLKFLAPPDWALRWIEGKLKLRVWLPYYVSVDQTYGRFGVIPMVNLSTAPVIAPGLTGSNQRLGTTPE
jgi:hypothetical protein